MPSAIVEVRDPTTGRFAPGHRPAGRPKGFAGVARMIMEATRDGAELVEWALFVWRDPQVEMKHREEAFKWLSDRGLGKPLQQLELGPPGSMEDHAERTKHLTVEQLREMVLLERRKREILDGAAPHELEPALEHRDQNPKVLDGAAVLLPRLVATMIDVPDDDATPNPVTTHDNSVRTK